MRAGVTGEAVCNDLLTPRGGPDLWRTPGGPRGSGRLSHILAICAQLDLRGDCATSALGSVGAAWQRMSKKKEKKEREMRGGGSESVTSLTTLTEIIRGEVSP